MPTQHTIVLQLDSNGNLINPGITQVDRNDYVLWKIETGTSLKGFKIIGANNPFNSLPVNHYWVLLGRHIRPDAPSGEWKYNIRYMVNGTPHEIDPKIAVRPSKTQMPLLIAGLSLLAVVTILTIYNNFISLRNNKILKSIQKKFLENKS